MTSQIGAPGTVVARRQFLAATGGVGAASLAGCTAPTDAERLDVSFEQTNAKRLPLTGKPEVVDRHGPGGKVTITSVKARHEVHPHDTMGGPINLPVAWAFHANDGTPSVPGPIPRATEGQKIELTLDDTGMEMPHTFHGPGLRKTWENDGVPTATGIQDDPSETHTYEFEANVPGTHLYHCHCNTPWHIDMGMYGVPRMDPKDARFDTIEPARSTIPNASRRTFLKGTAGAVVGSGVLAGTASAQAESKREENEREDRGERARSAVL